MSSLYSGETINFIYERNNFLVCVLRLNRGFILMKCKSTFFNILYHHSFSYTHIHIRWKEEYKARKWGNKNNITFVLLVGIINITYTFMLFYSASVSFSFSFDRKIDNQFIIILIYVYIHCTSVVTWQYCHNQCN